MRLEAISRGMWVPGGVEGRGPSVPTVTRLRTGLSLSGRVRLERPSLPVALMDDMMSVHLSLDDYVAASEIPGGSSEAVVKQIVATQDPQILLAQLSFLNHAFHRPKEEVRFLTLGYRELLRPGLRQQFDRALEGGEEGDGDVVLFSRQTTLAAIRAVLEAYPESECALEQPSLATAILLVHAVSSSLGELDESDARSIGDMPAGIVMEVVRNSMFNENDDAYLVIARTLRYWQNHIVNLKRTELRDDPHYTQRGTGSQSRPQAEQPPVCSLVTGNPEGVEHPYVEPCPRRVEFGVRGELRDNLATHGASSPVSQQVS